jgi:hypothetical protein
MKPADMKFPAGMSLNAIGFEQMQQGAQLLLHCSNNPERCGKNNGGCSSPAGRSGVFCGIHRARLPEFAGASLTYTQPRFTALP